MTTELNITHSFAEGTLISGGARGDGSYEILTAHGWRWFRSLGVCGIRQSRDKLSKDWIINSTAEALRAAGFAVTVEIDNDPRPVADREAEKAEHMEARADMLAERAEKRANESNSYHDRAHQLSDRIPFGQPILVGHHSERRARRDANNIHNWRGKGFELGREATRLTNAAESAATYTQHRENPFVTARRLAKLEADRRDTQRRLDGHTRNFRDTRGEIYTTDVTPPASGGYRERLLIVAKDQDMQVEYWRAFLETEKAAGRYNPVDVAAIKPGDRIKHGGMWNIVKKVNKSTITVVTDPGWNNKVKILDVTEHRPAKTVIDESK